MGFFKSVFRGAKKVLSGAAKIVKKAVKGVIKFAKSPAGMATIALLGGAFFAGGGFTSFLAGRAGGQSIFGSVMSTMKTGFSSMATGAKGLFGGVGKGVTISGAGATTAGTTGLTTGYTAGTSTIMSGLTGGTMAMPASGSFVIPLSAASKAATAAEGSFMTSLRKKYTDLKIGQAVFGRKEGEFSPYADPNMAAEFGQGQPPAAFGSAEMTSAMYPDYQDVGQARPVNLNYNVENFMKDGFGITQYTSADDLNYQLTNNFNNMINSWNAFGTPGGAGRRLGG